MELTIFATGEVLNFRPLRPLRSLLRNFWRVSLESESSGGIESGLNVRVRNTEDLCCDFFHVIGVPPILDYERYGMPYSNRRGGGESVPPSPLVLNGEVQVIA